MQAEDVEEILERVANLLDHAMSHRENKQVLLAIFMEIVERLRGLSAEVDRKASDLEELDEDLTRAEAFREKWEWVDEAEWGAVYAVHKLCSQPLCRLDVAELVNSIRRDIKAQLPPVSMLGPNELPSGLADPIKLNSLSPLQPIKSPWRNMVKATIRLATAVMLSISLVTWEIVTGPRDRLVGPFHYLGILIVITFGSVFWALWEGLDWKERWPWEISKYRQLLLRKKLMYEQPYSGHRHWLLKTAHKSPPNLDSERDFGELTPPWRGQIVSVIAGAIPPQVVCDLEWNSKLGSFRFAALYALDDFERYWRPVSREEFDRIFDSQAEPQV